MSRWGGGGRLVVGLAPAKAVPKSGLHMVYTTGAAEDRHAAYLAGIYNSALFQQLAETLAPGQTRGGEIEAFGLPDLDADTRDWIADQARTLATLVTDAATRGGVFDAFPQMRDVLRSDVTLGELPDAWAPPPGPANRWGTVGSVGWLDVSDFGGPQARAVTGVSFDTTLGGDVLRLHPSNPAAEAHLDLLVEAGGEPTDRDRAALAAWAEGLAVRRVQLRHVAGHPVPIDVSRFVNQYATDRTELERFADAYRRGRATIDGAFA
jgi:hypothetical protein